jgi:hypothetical protein
MPKASAKNAIPPCGCNRSCRCQRKDRCLSHDTNALLALALWDYKRALRGRRPTSN